MPKIVTTEIFLERVKSSNMEMFLKYDYTDTVYVDSRHKITVLCKDHGKFTVWPRDHMRGMSGCRECIINKRKESLLHTYGVDNFYKRNDLIQQAMLEKHGVVNPGLMPDHLKKIKATNIKNYGIEWSSQSPEVIKQRELTNILKYGYKNPAKNSDVSKKMVSTKVSKGSYTKTNSSHEATRYIKEYIKIKNYDINQCAFSSIQDNVHEWGIFYEGKWRLFDLVVFEVGHRGNKEKIIEILEYHGPFHYTEKDVIERGSDRACPWKSKKTTIKESYECDKIKEKLARSLTNNFNIVWAYKNPNEVIAENVRKLEARYPGGKFDVYRSENRADGDL